MKQTPTKAGLFLAKGQKYKWWNFVVEVSGESPFLKIKVWDRLNDKIYRLEPSDIEEWGPEIPTEELGRR